MTSFLKRAGKPALAYCKTVGSKSPGVLFFPGFMSNMNGGKALALEEWCRSNDRQFTRFDYSALGLSQGKDPKFVDWVEDACDVFKELTEGPQVLVGSSMGAYVMLHVGNRYPDRVVGMVGVAPSFFRSIRFFKETPPGGFIMPPNYTPDGAPGLPGTFADGVADYDLFPLPDSQYDLRCKMHVIHGMRDDIISYTDTVKFVQHHIANCKHDVKITLCKNGLHRMSEPEDIDLILNVVQRVVAG